VSLTDFAEDLVLNALFRATNLTAPTTVFLALFSADPGEATPANELTAQPGYARQAVTFAAPGAGTGTSRRCLNSNIVVFTSTGAAWTTATHGMIFDSVTAGNPIAGGPLAAPRTVDAGGTLTFAAGQISVSLD
jgi:hypothetical protein